MSTPHPDLEPQPAAPPVTWSVVVALGLLWATAVMLLWLYVVEPYRANLTKREVAAMTKAALRAKSESSSAAVARRNLEKLQRSARLNSTDPKIYVLIAANHRVLHQYAEAIAAYDRALELEPTPNLYLNRGVTELAADRPVAARKSFERAVRFDPSLRTVATEAEELYRFLRPPD